MSHRASALMSTNQSSLQFNSLFYYLYILFTFIVCVKEQEQCYSGLLLF